MEIIYNYRKLKKNEYMIRLYIPNDYSVYRVKAEGIFRNRFGKIIRRTLFGGYDSFDEAIMLCEKFYIYKPKYLYIDKTYRLNFWSPKEFLEKYEK